ncbi:hypothetical protein Pint_24680 [Pistacia integerrima]|uniref:Uncharacterized protein n=1 Tax=Pistacia integerrima TaxID=434235 RepID=A0ACC0YHP9_9ROSI|nr:hypothetical protein Pint_24680 [Pistacia integerrima]
MISEVELQRNVIARPANSDGELLVCPRYLITQLMEDLLNEKASKEHGYFLAVTSLKNIDKGQVLDESGYASFPVTFKCRTFKPVIGDFLQGVVHYTSREGVFLRTGPLKYAFLPVLKMPGYSYVSEENPYFLNGNTHAKINNGILVCFVVLGVSWIEKTGTVEREFALIASIEGEILGPVSLPGTYELDL